MSIFCATCWASGGELVPKGTCSFFPRSRLIFRGQEWAYAEYVQALTCAEGMFGELGRMRRLLSPAARTCSMFVTAAGWRQVGEQFLLGGDVLILCGPRWADGQVRGRCSFFAQGWAGGHVVLGACSFFVGRGRPAVKSPGEMLILSAKGWADGPVRGDAHSSRGTCSFFVARSGHMGNMSMP